MKHLIPFAFLFCYNLSFCQIPVPAPPVMSNTGPGCEGNNFTLSGTGLAPGGQAIQVNGNNEWVNCGNAASLRPTNQLTLEAWVKPTSYADWDCVLSNFWDNSNNESGYGFVFVGGQCRMYLRTTNMAANDWNDNPGAVLPLNSWSHIAGTYDGAVIKFYLNGNLVASENKTGSIEWSQTTYGLNIARYNDSNEDNRFGGIIDEVRLWNTALPQATIQSWMYLELTTAHPDYASALISHYNFNGNVNSSNTQNNGTQNGGVFVVPDYFTYTWNGPSGFTSSVTAESTTVTNATAAQSGTYTVTATTPSGTVGAAGSTDLLIYPEYATTQTTTICQGQTYFAGGANQSATGVYTDNLTSVFGCDSIVTTNLTVTPGFSTTNNVSICQGDSYFAGGANQTTAGTYTDNLTSVSGCDSVVTTNITVNPVYNQVADISICQGDTYFAGGANQNTSGTYTDSFTSVNGCDSIITTNLTVIPAFANTVNAAICEGNAYFAGGANQTATGTYIDTYTSVNGCDSTITTNLTVLPVYTTDLNVFICQGQSYFCGGANQTTSGVYTDNLQSVAGCDSTVLTTLTVTPATTTTQDVAICQGESFFAQGANQTVAGTYTDLLQSIAGCDSTVITNLTVNPVYQTPIAVSICEGETYLAGGAQQSVAGIYTDNLNSVSGCDSIITTTLSVFPVYSQTRDVSICQGETYHAAGVEQTTSGVYTDLFQTANGCDSSITTTLTVNDTLAAFDFGAALIQACEGDMIVLDPQAGNGNYLWSNGATSPTLVVNEPGTYSVIVSNQCDTYSDEVTYTFFDCDLKLWVSNSFTPDGDGVNDIFFAKGFNLTYFDFTIYNRWGAAVFHTNDINTGWDGTFTGNPAQVGVYAWVIYYSGEGQGQRELMKTGYVSLIR